MLTAVPNRWFSWKFAVMSGSQAVAELNMSLWREKAWLTVQGVDCLAYREGLMSGDFILESAGSTLARAQKPSAFRRSFIIEHADRQYVLMARSAFRRAFVFREGDREVGSVSPAGVFTRRALVDLPETLPLHVKVFIIWLTIILWKRESDSAAS